MANVYNVDDDEVAIIKSFVFIDFETTGLSRPRITELCFISVNRTAFDQINNGRPRVTEKLVLAFDPGCELEPMASQLSNLTRYTLMQAGASNMDKDSVTMIHRFLQRQEAPVCLIAHNGNEYDFKILQAELKNIYLTLSESLLCADSLNAFREFQKGPKVSQSLGNIYQRKFGKKPEGQHEAETDTVALMEIVMSEGTVMRDWCDRNKKPFKDIPPRWITDSLM